MVPSYNRSLVFFPVLGCFHSRLPSASSVKFATVLGASFSKRRQTMVPSDVSKMAYVPGERLMNYLSPCLMTSILTASKVAAFPWLRRTIQFEVEALGAVAGFLAAGVAGLAVAAGVPLTIFM